ncbi:unnamed protein product [Victoria cruziana]
MFRYVSCGEIKVRRSSRNFRRPQSSEVNFFTDCVCNFIHSDKNRPRQIIINILSNSGDAFTASTVTNGGGISPAHPTAILLQFAATDGCFPASSDREVFPHPSRIKLNSTPLQ